MKRAALLLGCVFLAHTSPSLAHHSFLAEYDGDKQVTITGVVTELDWRNPHIHFYLDVTKSDGAVEKWKFEGFPPNMLLRNGWKKDLTLQPGMKVTVFGWQARDGSNLAHSRHITFEDGQRIVSGPPAGTGGGQPAPPPRQP
jgi:hypothetical protein